MQNGRNKATAHSLLQERSLFSSLMWILGSQNEKEQLKSSLRMVCIFPGMYTFYLKVWLSKLKLHIEIVISASHLLSEFQVSEHITCMDWKKQTSYLLSDCMHGELYLLTDWLRIQNTLQQSPLPKADIYPFASQAHSQECWNNFTNLHYECQTTYWWCGWVNVRLKWKSNCCNMCFEFLTNLSTELAIHACNQIADSLLKWQFPFYSRQV